MKVRTFFIGIMIAFALPWVMIVAVPFITMKDRPAVEYMDEEGNTHVYIPKDRKYIRGAEVYQQQNCQACHSMVIRNSFSGSEIYRQDWAGLVEYDEQGTTVIKDTRRESISWDYRENFASLGERRTGPDLSNYGLRVQKDVDAINEANAERIAAGDAAPVTADDVVYMHLFDPRHDTLKEVGLKHRSNCQSNKFLFTQVSSAGQGSIEALPFVAKQDKQVVPKPDAKALKDYLLGRIRNDELPNVLSSVEKLAASDEKKK